MDKFEAMRVFTRVVEAGGFTKAAESLRMPKATVTTLIQNLEAHLRVRLLHRTTRRVSVTADGAAYYERAVRILAEVEETETALTRSSVNPKGRLRVDVPGSLGRLVIIPALPQFFERYADIELDLGCGDRPVDLLEEAVDCVVRGGELADSSLVARRVGEMYMVTCASPDYLARYGMPQRPEDLERHVAINYFHPKTGKLLDFDFTRDGEQTRIMLRHLVAVNDSDAYVAAGLAGLGILQAPLFMVQDHVAAGRLELVLCRWVPDSLPLYVVYPQNRHLSAKVRAFVEWIAELFADSDLIQSRTSVKLHCPGDASLRESKRDEVARAPSEQPV